MTDLPTPGVASRVAAAQAAALQAAARVRRTSAARLTELLRLPPAERFAHLDEPALVASDRIVLRRSFQSVLPGRRGRSRLKFRLRGPRTRRHVAALVRLGLTPEIIVPLLLVLAWLGLAWTRTAHLATFTRDVPFQMIDDNGQLVDAVLPKHRSAIVGMDWNGTPRLRHWLPRRGYETLPLPRDAITWGVPQ